MRIVRTPRTFDLRTVPIDGFDMFILSRVDEVIDLVQLAEILPCEPTETMERVQRLAKLGLVRIVGPQGQGELGRARIREPRRAGPGDETEDFEDAVTLRPPPRPEGRLPRVSSPYAFSTPPTTGMRRRPEAEAPVRRRTAR